MDLSVVVEKEGKFYVARIPDIDVTSQGKTFEEALENVKEAAELYLEDPAVKRQLRQTKAQRPIFTMVNVTA